MDLLKLIKQRKSIRAFTKEVPPRHLILECLEAAAWAPNPTSQQPWQFIVLSGDSLKKVTEIIKESYSGAAGKAAPQLTENSENARILEQRKKENFSEMLGFLKEHNADMTSLGEGNFNFHQAPMAIIRTTLSQPSQPCRPLCWLPQPADLEPAGQMLFQFARTLLKKNLVFRTNSF